MFVNVALAFLTVSARVASDPLESFSKSLARAAAKSDALDESLANQIDGFTQLGGSYQVSASSSCIATGQCYAGSNAAQDCCVHHVIDDPLHCTEGLTCGACTTAAKYVVGALVKQGCIAIIPEGVTICEVIGFGPEDPFADICALVVSGACPLISTLVKRGIKDPGMICQRLKYCTAGGGGTGRIFGTKCGCVAKGYCTANDDGCCSGSATRGFNHCLPIGLKICN